jgi:hypothetical protein
MSLKESIHSSCSSDSPALCWVFDAFQINPLHSRAPWTGRTVGLSQGRDMDTGKHKHGRHTREP